MLSAGGSNLGTFPLDITSLTSGGVQIFPDGMKSAGTAYDEMTATKATKRIGVVDLGTLTYTLYSSSLHIFRCTVPGKKKAEGNCICSNYVQSSVSKDAMADKEMQGIAGYEYLYIRDTAYSDAAAFKAAMSGVYLYYEQAYPEEFELVTPIPMLVASDVNGTQKRLPEDTASSVSAPMVCDFQYGVNPRDLYDEEKSEIAGVRNAITDILTQLPSSGKSEIPTEAPANPENTKTYIYYDDVNHKICVREKDGTVYSIHLST